MSNKSEDPNKCHGSWGKMKVLANKTKKLRFIKSTTSTIFGTVLLITGASVYAAEMEISGVVEVEMGLVSTDDNTSSDISLATVEIGLDGTITEGVDVHILMLHEEDDTPLEIDEGTITLSNIADTSLSLTVGQMYLPFGKFESNMVSDPLTLEIGETRESTLALGYELDGIYGSFYVFNGNSENSTDDNASDFGLNISYTTNTLDIGVSYLSSLAETDTMQESVDSAGDNVPGAIGMHAIVSMGKVKIIAEYVTAIEEFDAADFSFEGEASTPSAYSAEIAYTLSLMGKETTMAASVQGTKEAANAGLAESRIMFGLSSALKDNTSLSLEFMNESDVEGGEGDGTNIVTAQIAVAF